MTGKGERQELKRRLALLDPLFRDLGAWIIGGYAKAGILDAMQDELFPVADAVFSRRTRVVLGRTTWTYSPRGPVYFGVTRAGRLLLAGREQDKSITEAVHERTEFARPGDSPWAQAGPGTAGSPSAAVFLMDPVTSDLYIRAVDPAAPHSPVQVRPLGQYARERASLFIVAFKATG